MFFGSSQHTALTSCMLLPGSTLLLAPLLAPPPARHAPPAMGGYTGLPRMPVKAWPLTRRWNPTLEYRENIATLWRDLETLCRR